MSDHDYLLTDSAGIRWSLKADSEGPGAHIVAEGSVTPVLEQNKAMASHNNGYTPDKTFRRAFSIPIMVQYKWLTEEGLDVYSPDPDQQRRLCAKLDSTEYMYLRTAEFRLGDHWRHSI